MKTVYFGLLAGALLTASCRKRPDPLPPSAPPQLKLQFENRMDGQPLKLKQNYLNAHGDTFYITSYKYYISNIKLIGENGSIYLEPESYHLIDEKKEESKSITLPDVPIGRWNKIRFLIGVDSARNVSGAQTGALDPLNGMFWTWNTGYIMAALEGSSPQAGIYPNNLGFHLGGFSGPRGVLKWIELPLPSPIQNDSGIINTIVIQSEISEWFKTPNTIDFSDISTVSSPGTAAHMIADNYADMFTIKK